jgi:hypothetical protein
MLRLDLPTQSFWVDCPYGVRLLCRPLTTALNAAAGARAARRLRDMAGSMPEDADMAAGIRTAEVTVALAEVVVEAWEGVGNAEGTEPAPLTPEGLRLVITIPEVARAFDAGVSAPLARMVAEGNG